MTATWRLLVDDGPADGAWNMALDRAIQRAHVDGEVPPTVRLYRWARPTVSLGRFQDVCGVDRDACAREGVDVVRRFTGGRGVLHDDELTYSIVAGLDDGIPRTTADSYRVLCKGLVEAYRLLGVEADLTTRPRGDGVSAACYLCATLADLSAGALKLSGSAQVWHHSTVLQHGSFTVTRDVAREARVFRLAPRDAVRMADETATIADSLGRRPSDDELGRAVLEGIERGLGVRLESGDITERERAEATSLIAETSADSRPSRSRVITSG